MKVKKISLIVVILVITLVCIIAFLRGEDVKYNNDKSIAELITKKHASSDIEKMKKEIEQDSLDYKKLKSCYKIQCLRKTYQGYYAVFLQNDGKRIFVFMDDKMQIYNMLVVENIRKKGEYNFVEIENTTEKEIIEYDENTIFFPVSSVTCTAHIVQEGILVITYNRLDSTTGILLNEPVVKSISFYKNEDFPLTDNEMINLSVPYILEKDKK